jgi:hypothetical protein
VLYARDRDEILASAEQRRLRFEEPEQPGDLL